MKRIPLLVLAAVLAGCTISGPASVPGGMASDRPAIAYGQTVNGALEATDQRADDESFYDAGVFNGRAGETVEITLPEDGEYVIRANSYTADQTGSYTLIVESSRDR